MIDIKEQTMYGSYTLISAAIRNAAKLTACGYTVEVRKVGNVYMIVGA